MEGEVSYEPDEGQAARATRDVFVARLKRWRSWRPVLVICIALGALVSALNWMDGYAADDVAISFLIGFGIGAAGPAVTWGLCFFTLPLRARRAFREMRVRCGPHRWQWTAEGFSITTPNGVAAYDWDELLSATEGRHSFLLFVSESLPLFLPREVLTPEQGESFRVAMRAGITTRG